MWCPFPNSVKKPPPSLYISNSQNFPVVNLFIHSIPQFSFDLPLMLNGHFQFCILLMTSMFLFIAWLLSFFISPRTLGWKYPVGLVIYCNLISQVSPSSGSSCSYLFFDIMSASLVWKIFLKACYHFSPTPQKNLQVPLFKLDCSFRELKVFESEVIFNNVADSIVGEMQRRNIGAWD